MLLRLTPDMEDKELEEINKQTDDQDVDASLGGGEILLQAIPEEICNRAQRLFAELRKFSVLLTKCCSDLVIDLMQVSEMHCISLFLYSFSAVLVTFGTIASIHHIRRNPIFWMVRDKS